VSLNDRQERVYQKYEALVPAARRQEYRKAVLSRLPLEYRGKFHSTVRSKLIGAPGDGRRSSRLNLQVPANFFLIK
jgi:hypothetical protein